MAITAALAVAPVQAFALSEMQLAPERRSPAGTDPEMSPSLPLPDPLINRPASAPDDSTIGDGDEEAPAEAEIILDPSQLPEPVRRMRDLLVEAAASGDIERLRPLTNPGPRQTQVNGEINDPILAMRSYSGDADGLEILAILLDLLSTGAARLDPGTPEEVYLWPYFAAKNLAQLTPPERVELLRIVTAGDLLGMEEAGNYNFYRIAITPEGEWKSFTGGD
ncbi:MAG TPA: hypothetical protein VHG11_07585 [Pseudorhizobium sp.]|nr:hypothetical protein [Pseudorhizobium sp.]